MKIQLLIFSAFMLIIVESVLSPLLLFRAPVGGIVLNLYVVIGLCSLFFQLIRVELQQDSSRRFFEQMLKEITQGATPLQQRWRNWLYLGLFLGIRITCWPAFELGPHAFQLMQFTKQLRTQLHWAAAGRLYPYETSVSFFLLVLPVVVTAYAVLSFPPFVFTVYFLWLLVFTLFLKHLSYLIGSNPVQERLRRGRSLPLLSYALITGCDFAGLVLCYNGIINFNAGPAFDSSVITSIVTRLFALKDIINVFKHPPERIIDYCIGVSGLLWWLTLAQSLLKIKNYKRTPLDYLALAASYILLSKDDLARAALDNAAVTDKLPCLVKGHLYAAMGDFDKATLYVQRYLRQIEDVPLPPNNINYIFLNLYGGIAVYRNTSETMCRYIEYGSAHGLSDVLLSMLALEIREIGINPWPVARFVEQEHLADRFPLTYVALMFATDEEREVLNRFDYSEPTEPDARRATWLCLAALLWPARRRSNAETQAFCEQWSQSYLTEIQQITVVLDDQIEKYMLSQTLMNIRVYWSTAMGVELSAVPAVVTTIDASLRPNEEVLRLRSISMAQQQKLSQVTIGAN